MTVFNRRNALVGFVTLKAASRARRRRQQRLGGNLRTALFVTAAIVSVGVLAVVAVAFLKAKKSGPQHLEGYAAAEDAEKIPDGGEAETASADPGAVIAEPIPAT